MRWLLCDYGGVLSLPQSGDDLARLAELTGLGGDELRHRYWERRAAYDRADLTVAEYWAGVVGHPVNGTRLAALVDADRRSWLHLNDASIAAAGRVAARGVRLALLSNAPVEIASGIRALPELAAFQPCCFSCDLRLIKPEPEIYQRVLAEMGAAPGEVTFVDDRADNVAAAAALGLTGLQFRAVEQFDEL